MDYEYWDNSPTNTPEERKRMKLAEPYQNEIDLAFFVVNFGYSKEEYMALTEIEKAFIRKEFERKIIADATYLRDSVFNAVSNVMRKKGAKFQELFKRKQAKADIEFNEQAIDVVMEIEYRDGKSWIDQIYHANGLGTPKGGN